MLNSRNIFVRSLPCSVTMMIATLIAILFTVLATASAQDPASSSNAGQPPVAYASVNELNTILAQLKQTTQSIQADLTKTRIDKWKTDGSTKKQTMATVDSIQRNLQGALPETIAQLNASPEDLSASFKLYRNLVLLNDYFGSIVESAGAFGTKDEFQSLGNDMTGLDTARRTFAERVTKLAASKEEELTRLRAQVKTLSAAPPPPPKKIVVDDTEPVKKPVKKKVVKPKPPATDAAPTTPPPQ